MALAGSQPSNSSLDHAGSWIGVAHDVYRAGNGALRILVEAEGVAGLVLLPQAGGDTQVSICLSHCRHGTTHRVFITSGVLKHTLRDCRHSTNMLDQVTKMRTNMPC